MIRIAVGSAEEKDRGAWGETFRWEGVPGEKKRVSCYTNGDEAELFLNGKSLGRKKLSPTDGGRACWIVPYEAGELEARGVRAADKLSTPGTAVHLRIRAARHSMAADGMQVLQLEAELTDEHDRPAKDELIHCQVLGDITLLGLENGQPDDLTPYSASFRRTREGTLTLYVRAGKTGGTASVHVRTGSGLHASRTIRLTGSALP